MDSEQAELYINMKVRIVLSNGFNFTGIVQSVDSDSMHIIDKFDCAVALKLSEIMVCSEVKDGYGY